MLKKSFTYLDRGVEFLIFVILVLMVVIGGMQVFNRFVLNQSLSWSEEFQKFAHIWLIFLTIPVGYNRGSHIGMEVVVGKFPRSIRQTLVVITDLVWLILAGAIVYYTTFILRVAQNQTSPGLGLRMDRVYLGLIVGGIYLAIVALRKLAAHLHFGSKLQEGGTPC
jgi:TRAP-type transport system small permease protein